MSGTAKTCIRCAQDCSGRPRIKTAHGHYICRACLKPEETTRLSQPAAPAPPAPATIPEPDNAIPLALADAESAAPAAPAVCPACRSSIPHGAMVCIQCGYHLATGRQFQTRAGDALPEDPTIPDRAPGRPTCPKCGYDLRGLKKPRCPECGTVVLPKDIKERARDTSRDATRWAYLKPLIQIAVGVSLCLLLAALLGQQRLLPGYAILYAVQIPIGCAAYFICCLLWLGFDAPMHLTAVRLAGVFALAFSAWMILRYVPFFYSGYAALMLVYDGLLADALELDFEDAALVGLVTFIINIAAMVAIASVILSR